MRAPASPTPPRRRRVSSAGLLLLLALAASAGGCDGDGVRPVDGALSAGAAEVDFGVALEGTEVLRELALRNDGRASLQVTLGTQGPFHATGALTLAGGVTERVQLRWVAGAAAAQGVLTASAQGQSVQVALRGEGVRPPSCAAGPCRTSRFDLATRACVVEVQADGTACTPTSACLEHGQCVAGACLGSPRSCDDGNACTVDVCAEGTGCQHVPRACPLPPAGQECKVATCDPRSAPDEACGIGDAEDGAWCGTFTCEATSRCSGGACKGAGPAPVGTVCGPATPCRAEAVCKDPPDGGARACIPPEPVPLGPPVRSKLAGDVPVASVSALRGHEGSVFTVWCGADGACALVSSTRNGFGRYSVPLAGPAELVSVSPGGVLLREGATLVRHAVDPPGQEQWRFVPSLRGGDGGAVAATAADRIVTGPAGEVAVTYTWTPAPDAGLTDGGEAADAGAEDGGVARDGGVSAPVLPVQTLVLLAADGAVTEASVLEGLGLESLLAQAEDGGLWLSSAEGPVALAPAGAGGPLPERVGAAPAGRSLVVAGGRVVLGGRALLEADGGTTPLVFQPEGEPALTVGALPVLVDGPWLYVLGERCLDDSDAGCPRGVRLHAFSAGRAVAEWSSWVYTPEEGGVLVEAAVLRAPGWGSGVGAVSQLDGGTSVRGALHLLAGGREVERCYLPDAPTLQAVERALFDGQALHVITRRAGVDGGAGAAYLESYPLTGLQAPETGWPQASGVSGTRRAR